MKTEIIEMPEKNKRLLQIVEHYAEGNVTEFSRMLGLKQQTVERVFRIDNRTKKYPSNLKNIEEAMRKKLIGLNFNWYYNNDGDMVLDNNKTEQLKENVSMEAILKLIDSNKVLADAHRTFADSNLKLASTNERLSLLLQSAPTENGLSEIDLKIRANIDRTLEAVALLISESGKGKHLSQGKAYERMSSIVYERPMIDEETYSTADVGTHGK